MVKTIWRGIEDSWLHQLVGPDGRLDGRWTSEQEADLEVRFWPGQARGYTSATSVGWEGEPSEGAVVRITLDAAATAALELGRTRYVILLDGLQIGSGQVETIPAPTTASPGGDDAPFSYASDDDFRRLARSYVATWGDAFNLANLADVLAGSTRRLKQKVAGRYAVTRRSGNVTYKELYDEALGYLDAEGLDVSEDVIRFVVFDAVADLAGTTPGRKDTDMTRIMAYAEQERDKAMEGAILTLTGGGIDHEIRFHGFGRVSR